MPVRQDDIAIDIGPSSARSSSDFEEVPYPPSHWAAAPNYTNPEEDLQLHYMSDEKARRRAPRAYGRSEKRPSANVKNYDDDDDGKNVYAKFSPRVSSGRAARMPPPPPMTLVRILSDIKM
jgi:dolichyl-phosphate-mannose-protein mannosyltransferase